MRELNRFDCYDENDELLGVCKIYEFTQLGQVQFYLETILHNLDSGHNPDYINYSNCDNVLVDNPDLVIPRLAISTNVIDDGDIHIYTGCYFGLLIGNFFTIRVPYGTSKITNNDDIVVVISPVKTNSYIFLTSISTNIHFDTGLITTSSFLEQDSLHQSWSAYIADRYNLRQVLELLPPYFHSSEDTIETTTTQIHLSKTNEVSFSTSTRLFHRGEKLTQNGVTYTCLNTTTDINYDTSPNWTNL